MDTGTICRIKKSTGPFSSGTLVEVISTDNDLVKVKLLITPQGKFLSNIKKHGVNEDGVFNVKVDKLTPRRYRVGRSRD